MSRPSAASGGRTLDAVTIERSELRLVWPPDLFATEAQALLAAGADDDALAGLLAEAFHGDRGDRLLRETAEAQPYHSLSAEDLDPWLADGYRLAAAPEPFGQRAAARLVEELARDVSGLPQHQPRPLFRQRQRVVETRPLTVAECRERYARLIGELTRLGYFEDAFGSECSDSRDNPSEEGQRVLAERLELPDVRLWPPVQVWSNVFEDGSSAVHEGWSDEVFYDVIEALDELVARPRQRSWHSHHEEWDYADYSRSAGQAVYRWRVNALLDQSDVPLRVAGSGSDAGLLVHATGDPRDDLTDRALDTADNRDRAEVAHAVALFRGRAVSREEKRSAIFTLGRVLEERRPLIYANLVKKDAGALFQIANEFDLRHRRASDHGKPQRDDYDDAFLDWVYWWYLSTVELTNQLLSVEGGATQP